MLYFAATGNWKAIDGCSDYSDVAVAREYLKIIFARFSGKDLNLIGELEKTVHPEVFIRSLSGTTDTGMRYDNNSGECRILLKLSFYA